MKTEIHIYILTEEDCQVLRGASQGLERFGRHVLDHVLVLAGRVLVLYEPLEDVLFT